MARPFSFPDVKDRSVNSPVFLVSPEQVLGNYNQENKSDHQGRVNDKVKFWFVAHAVKVGWTSGDWHGNQCLLFARLE